MRLLKSTVKVNCCLLGKLQAADFASGKIILQKQEQTMSLAVFQPLLCQMKACLFMYLSVDLYGELKKKGTYDFVI